MFNFVVKYWGFLKHIPGLGILFDTWLKIITLITRPRLLDYTDDIERQVSAWEGVDICSHKYGGIQFNYNNREIGHIHGNGLLDILLSRSIKQQLMHEGKIKEHHVFKNTGWISFYVKTDADKEYAINLLKLGYQLRNSSFAPGSDNQISVAPVVTVLA